MIRNFSSIPKIRSFIIGCGVTKFEKPKKEEYPNVAKYVISRALKDARIDLKDAKRVVTAFCPDRTCISQSTLHQIGLTQIPIHNITNCYSTGVFTLALAKQLIENGVTDCILALGYEKIKKSLKNELIDRKENHLYSASEGLACCIVANEDFVHEHKLESQAVEIVAIEVVANTKSSAGKKNKIEDIEYDFTKVAVQKLFGQTSYKPQDVNFIVFRDHYSNNEIISYEAFSLCLEGKDDKMTNQNQISQEYPIGATGLVQCSELCWQLRGDNNKNQVENDKLALQYNYFLDGALFAALYHFSSLETIEITRTSSISHKQKVSVANKNRKPTEDDFFISPLIKIIDQVLLENHDRIIEKVPGIYGFRVINGPGGAEGYWVINAKNGVGKFTFNGTEKPDITFTLEDKDAVALIQEELNPIKALYQSKVKVSGNIGMALRLVFFQELIRDRVRELRFQNNL